MVRVSTLFCFCLFDILSVISVIKKNQKQRNNLCISCNGKCVNHEKVQGVQYFHWHCTFQWFVRANRYMHCRVVYKHRTTVRDGINTSFQLNLAHQSCQVEIIVRCVIHTHHISFQIHILNWHQKTQYQQYVDWLSV